MAVLASGTVSLVRVVAKAANCTLVLRWNTPYQTVRNYNCLCPWYFLVYRILGLRDVT